MARIFRKAQKIFALGAANNGVFGSAADNTKILSSDLDVIQSKPAYNLGWLEAVLGIKKFPPLEEFQALHYMTTSQIAYLFQEGIPEWDEDTTYYQKSIVKKSGTYEIYGSINDDNLGNPLTDDTEWLFLQDLASSTVPDATTLIKGIAMLAQIADVRALNQTKIVTPDLLAQYGFRTGDIKMTSGSSLQDGWTWGAGTIGNAASGADRANADAEELFKFYWNDAAYNYAGTNAVLPALQVYSSAGAAVAKGASAAADWAANRRIAVPDYRDRVIAGRGNMVGNAGRLSGQPFGVNGNTLGAAGGQEAHTMTLAELVQHQHNTHQLINAQAGFTGPGAIDENGLDEGNTDNAGSSQPFNVVQPTIICNIIIKL